MKLLSALAVVAVTAMFGGCATYTPSLAKIDNTGAGTSKQVSNSITAFADEYASKAKSEKVFDMNLRDDGVMPVLVTLQNGNKFAVDMKTMDIAMRDGSGTLKLLTPEEAATKAKKSSVGRAIGWSLIVPIIGIPIAATASVMHTNKVNRQILEDFTAKALTSGTIAPGKEVSGFLFFEVDKVRTDFPSLAVDVKLTADGSPNPFVVSVPLAPLMMGAPVTTPAAADTPAPATSPTK